MFKDENQNFKNFNFQKQINDSLYNQNNFEPSSLKHYISKKTHRGRKIKNPLPNITKCEICLEYNDNYSNSLISCSICKCNFHINCYPQFINKLNIKEFKCERCYNSIMRNIPIESTKCFICSLNNGILSYNEKNNIYYHLLCLKFISELYEDCNINEISRDKIRKWRYKNSCKYCNEKLSKEKAVIKCKNPKCKCYYHIPCAIEKGMIFSINYLQKFYSIQKENKNVSIPFFCSSHNKRLAAQYRKNIVYNNNFNPLNLNNDNYYSDFNRNKIRKLSNNFNMENENNYSETMEISNTFNNGICDFTNISPINNNYNEVDNDDNISCFEYNKILDLNFNEFLISDIEDEKNEYIINFDNLSPEDKIPYTFFNN